MNLRLLERTSSLLYSVVALISILFYSGCGGVKPATTSKKSVPIAKPDWLGVKPVDDGYYIGIGHATKDGTNNYIQEAKKSALEDLVSEIKVEVASTSVLSQIDQNKQFQQTYQQIIQTKAADEITEFEQNDAWQDERNYWVYYRLSKQRYKDIKDAEKRDAVTIALDFFTKAKQSEKEVDYVEALGFYFQGFRAIEKYLNEPIQVQFQGNDIFLTNEIFANLQLLLDKIQITATPAEINVNRRIQQSGFSITAKAFLKVSNKPVPQLPLLASFDKGSGNVFPDYKTGDDGLSKILLTKISAKDLEQTIGIKLNLLSFSGGDSTSISSLVAQKMAVPKANVLLHVQRPLVFVSSVEKSFDNIKADQQLTNRLKNFITNSGFEITPDKSKADLWMDINANSEKGSPNPNPTSIWISYVTAVIRVVTVKDGTEIYSTTLERIKGYSLDYDRASQAAYNTSMDILQKDKMPELLNAILQ